MSLSRDARRFSLVVALSWIGICVQGASLRTLPLVNPRSDALESGSIAAKIAGMRDRSAAALSKAWAAQELARSSALSSEQVQMEALTASSQLQDLSNQATQQADSAAAASKETVGVVRSMESSKDDTVKRARELAVDRVREMFMAEYNSLADWRGTVLQDHSAKAARAGAKAAEPYQRALDAYYGRIQAYQAQAGSMARESRRAVADANMISDAAQTKIQAGDTVGANQDLELARAMQARGSAYAEHATALQSSANQMNQMVGVYYSAGQAASERAAYEADPNSMPGLQADPNRAYAPPLH